MKKTLITILVTVLLCVGVVGTTFAWLMDKTEPIKNTFTFGNIDIELTETEGTVNDDVRSFKMMPGATIDKDPTVTVKAGSEACWLFVKIDKSTNFDDFMTYTIAGGWTELETGVYYRKVESAVTQDTEYGVLLNDKITVKDSVTKDMFDAIADPTNAATAPSLTLTAYAVQLESSTTPAGAWAIANPTT